MLERGVVFNVKAMGSPAEPLDTRRRYDLRTYLNKQGSRWSRVF